MKEKDIVKLNYYQIMIFLYGIGKLRENNNQIDDDEIVSTFSKSSLKAIGEIVRSSYGFLPIKVSKKMKLYQIPRTTYNYLVKITSINPVDFKNYKFYKNIIEKIDEQQNDLMEEHLKEVRESIKQKYDTKFRR